MMTQQEKTQIASRIIELELENIDMISKGHKPTRSDSFEPKRQEIELLRCLYFGYKSNFCKLRKGTSSSFFL